MTGFGKAQGTVNGADTTVEVRSVNGRFLEVSVRAPKDWMQYESATREVVRQNLTRGSVNLYIRREDVQQRSLAINVEAARVYVDALRELQNELSLSGTIGIEHLISYEPAFTSVTSDEAEAWPELQSLITMALASLDTMRVREGEELAADMQQRLTAIAQGLDTVESTSAMRIPQERERLRERVRQLVADEMLDEQRLQLEIVLLSEKLDVSEECVRLRSHIKHYQADIAAGGVIGRKLNFLLQEMNREVNTIGSKSNDASIAMIVVGMKEELERIREQVQNLE